MEGNAGGRYRWNMDEELETGGREADVDGALKAVGAETGGGQGDGVSSGAIFIQTFGGIAFLGCPLLAGLLGRPPAILLAFIFVLVVLKPISGRTLWISNVQEKGTGVLAPMIVATLTVQGLLGALLYFAGRAAGSAVGYGKPALALESFDWGLVIATLLLGLILGELRREG